MKPSVARMVHYLSSDGECLAAVITGVHEDEPRGTTVGLHVMPDEGFPYRSSGVPEGSPDGDSCTWHWPERVE